MVLLDLSSNTVAIIGLDMEQQKIILLNVYDIHTSNVIFSELGLGLYHSGIEISVETDDSLSYEYSFSKAGVSRTAPRMNIFGTLRATIPLGKIRGTAINIHKLIAQFGKNDFAPGKYDLINHNCNHFTDAVAYALLETRIPSWVNRIAYFGSVFVAPPSATPPTSDLLGLSSSSTNGYNANSNSRTPAVRRIEDPELDFSQAESVGWLCGINLPFPAVSLGAMMGGVARSGSDDDQLHKV